MFCDGLAQFDLSGRRAVMGESIVERMFRGIADVLGRIEIGFANFEMND